MMNKFLALIPALLFLAIILYMQRLQTEKALIDIKLRLHHMEEELYQIDMVRRNRAAFEADRIETENRVDRLLKRLPAESGVDVFAEKLVSLFNEHNISLNIEYATSVDKDLYQEIEMKVHYGHAKLTESVLVEIFQKIERLVRWRLDEQGQVLVITLYRSLMDMSVPGIKPCDIAANKTVSYWPFGDRIEKKMSEFSKKCARRNKDEALLNRINGFEAHRRLATSLSWIVLQLSRDIEGH